MSRDTYRYFLWRISRITTIPMTISFWYVWRDKCRYFLCSMNILSRQFRRSPLLIILSAYVSLLLQQHVTVHLGTSKEEFTGHLSVFLLRTSRRLRWWPLLVLLMTYLSVRLLIRPQLCRFRVERAVVVRVCEKKRPTHARQDGYDSWTKWGAKIHVGRMPYEDYFFRNKIIFSSGRIEGCVCEWRTESSQEKCPKRGLLNKKEFLPLWVSVCVYTFRHHLHHARRRQRRFRPRRGL